MKKPVTYYLGNGLITLSFIMAIFIYYPLINIYFFPQKNISLKSSSFFIDIPKINAIAPIIPNVNPWNEKDYSQALDKGVALARGTAMPGEKGMSFLFAHSSEAPWKITRQNIAFLRLGDLRNGDLIFINKNGNKFEYVVYDKKEVWPKEVNYLKVRGQNELILQTCTPIGTALKRLLVFAKLKA